VISALHFAEEHSGNTSGLVTAKVLFDEAVEKAVRNQDSLALLMAARLANASGDADLAAELMAQSEAAASAAEGEKAGPYTFDLEVNNYWDEPVDVYIDDWYIDTVPINHYVYYSDLPVGYYYLYAYGLWTGGYTVVDVVGTSYGFVSVDLVY